MAYWSVKLNIKNVLNTCMMTVHKWIDMFANKDLYLTNNQCPGRKYILPHCISLDIESVSLTVLYCNSSTAYGSDKFDVMHFY